MHFYFYLGYFATHKPKAANVLHFQAERVSDIIQQSTIDIGYLYKKFQTKHRFSLIHEALTRK